MTTRLTHTMAWILSEKAILNHELTRAEQMADYRPLCEEETCIKCYDDVDDFPRGLITLMDDSLNLFLRASRIEDRLRS